MIIGLVKLKIIELGTLFNVYSYYNIDIITIFNGSNYKFLALVFSCNLTVCILAVFLRLN